MDGWIIFAIIGSLVAGVAIYGHWQEKKRTEAWQQAATELGLVHFGRQNDVLARFGHLRTFQSGHSRVVQNGITGDSGEFEITVADYQYTTGSGKSAQTHRQTLCILRRPGMALPACSLRPESRLGDFFGRLFGSQDIDFAEDPAFSAAYVLEGESEAAVRALFTPERRAWFAAQAGKNFHFEALGDCFLFHTGKRVPTSETRALMQEAIEILRILAPPQADSPQEGDAHVGG